MQGMNEMNASLHGWLDAEMNESGDGCSCQTGAVASTYQARTSLQQRFACA